MNFFKPTHPKAGTIYAITKGTYLGELFVFIENKSDQHFFLSLPDMKIRTVPSSKFKLGLDNKIIDIVERLPRKVFNVCKMQYNRNITNYRIPDVESK